jgi:hypothetical protein
MRKFYSDLLQENTTFKRKIRNVDLKHKLLISSSLELVKSLNLDGCDESISYYLSCLAFPHDVKKILRKSIASDSENSHIYENGVEIIQRIENALSKYSKKVLNEFIMVPEIALLLLNYLQKVQNKEYEHHYSTLKDLADKSISENSKNISENKSDQVEAKIVKLLA